MKHVLLLVLFTSTLTGHAQRFVCGQAHSGSVELTATSVYSAATPGFDLNTAPGVGSKSCSSDKPFFFPEMPYEKTGQYAAGTTFVEGLVVLHGKWYLYYGCADSLVGVAVDDPKARLLD